MFVSFCGLTQLLFSRLEKVAETRYTEERNVCIAYTFCGVWWLLENMRSDSILSGSHTGASVLALKVKMWKRVFEDEVFIENTRLEIGSKNTGQNSNEDVVLSSDHVVLLANGFSRLIVYVHPPSLFWKQVAYHPF